MPREHFQIVDDNSVPGRWYLKAPADRYGNPLDPEIFRAGRPVSVAGPLTITQRRSGQPLSWTFADFDMPVVSAAIADLLLSLAAQDIEVHPAKVEGHGESFAVINVLTCCACLDETRAEYQKWTVDDGRPDKAGQYRQVSRLLINHEAAENSEIFRIEGWRIALVVSGRVRAALEQIGCSGARFVRV